MKLPGSPKPRAAPRRHSAEDGGLPGPTVGVALRAHIQRLQQALDRSLDDLIAEVTADAVHASRTTARRLRAVLSAFRRQLNPAARRRYAAALQRLARDLDAVRDAQVAEQTILALSKKKMGLTREEFDGLKALVVQNSSRAVWDLRSVTASSPWHARLAAMRIVASDPGLIIESQEPMSSIILVVLERRRRRVRDALRYDGRAPRALHKLRLKIKMLRYLLEQCASTREATVRAEVGQLRELQDCLGDFHDAWCLRRAVKDQWRYRGATAKLRVNLKARQKELFQNFRKHRKRLRRVWRARRDH